MGFWRAFLLALVLALPGWGAGLELVLTLPVETQLKSFSIPATADTWLELIRTAADRNDSIDIEQFYISTAKGEPMEPVIAALHDAAKKGVPVRVIVDKTFLAKEDGGIKAFLGADGIEVRTLDYGKIADGVQHSKFLIVNRKQAYLGSANFDWRALKHIHETGLRITDTHIVTSLQAVFDRDWDRATPQGSFQFPSTPVTPVTVPPAGTHRFTASPTGDIPANVPSTIDSFLRLIGGAKQSIRLQTMEYSENVFGKKKEKWTVLQQALIAAAKKVSVQLLVDDSKSKDAALRALAEAGVEVKAVKLPEHSSGPIPFARLIHSKFMVVDEKEFWLGTDNFSKSYFYNSRGVGVVSTDAKIASQLGDLFRDLWDSRYSKSIAH